jgi:type IV pilus assembly protein PilA
VRECQNLSFSRSATGKALDIIDLPRGTIYALTNNANLTQEAAVTRKGFTLIELMIVVAIIGILAAIAIPNFLKFQCKSKTSEAKEMLKGIYTASVAYQGETDWFTNDMYLFGLDLGGATTGLTTGTGKYYIYYTNTTPSTASFSASAQTVLTSNIGQFNVGYYGINQKLNGMVLTQVGPCT